VKEMGDASSIGVMMNETYHLQMDYRLMGLILLGVFGGIISNLVYGYDIFYSRYFIWGIIVLCIVTVCGYRFCVLHTRALVIGAVILAVFFGNYGIASATIGGDYYYIWNIGEFMSGVLHRNIFSPTVFFNGMFLVIPLCAVLLYKGKNEKWSGILSSAALILIVVSGGIMYAWSEFLLGAITIVLISYIIMSVFAIGKKKEVLIPFLTVGFCVCLLCCRSGEMVLENLKLCFRPEVQATRRFDDAYNGVLIKELLRRAEFVGEIELSQEELADYGIGTWFFKDDVGGKLYPGEHYYYGTAKDYEKMEDVLPQHYLNNYRIAYVILKYGWGVGVTFLAGLAGLIGLLFFSTFRIKNRLGFFMALGSSLVLTIQILLYIAGNLGYQYGMFTNLPFISEGTVSITVNMILAGLVLSAYRYDRVTDEDRLGQKRKRLKRV